MDKRLEQLKYWLSESLNHQIHSIEPASADASFRRYFRAHTDHGTIVIMDAPPDKEDTKPFIASAEALAKLGVHTPAIEARDSQQGFLVLEDLGSRTYLNELRSSPNELYSAAIDALLIIQGGKNSSKFAPPPYDKKKLVEEMSLFSDWFIQRHLGENLNDSQHAVWLETKQVLAQACLEQPQTWVHRDYHSRNLMITENNSPGVIDFQDIVVGPIGYDLASIFKDCYIEWPRKQQQAWLKEYHEKARTKLKLADFSLEQLVRWVDLAGLQRHLKVLGIFCRLSYRDKKESYLADLPLVAKYVIEVLDIYPELNDFKNHFQDSINKAR